LFLIKYVPYFSNDAIVFLIGIGLIIGNVLFPVWFLNGLEMMTTIAVVQVATKIFAIPLIFTLVRDFNDAPVLLAINSSASITCGVITLVWMKSNLPIFSSVPQLRTIVQELKEGAPVFVSTVAISLYTTLTPAVLGVLAGPTSVGQFLLADRVRQVAQASLSPITHALFPRMSFLFANDPQAARVLTRKSGTVLALLSSICSITIFLGADFIIRVLGGQRFEPAAVVLKWFSPLIFIVAMSNLFGVQILLAQRKYRQVNAVLITAGVGSLIMLKPLITWKGETGAAMNALVVETFVTLAFIVLVFLLRRQPSA
jgi:O-antigen/teichoic acid export membrane protein